MTALEQRETLSLAGAALRVSWWNAFAGALLLTDKRLIFEAPWAWDERGVVNPGSRDYALPLESISNARPCSRVPTVFCPFLPVLFFMRNQFRANLAVTSDGRHYYFRVRDPAAWIRGIDAGRDAAKRSWHGA